MNWEKGLKRVALVSAVLVGLLHCVLAIAYEGGWLVGFFSLIRLDGLPSAWKDWVGMLIIFLIGFLPIWGIPCAIFWALKGFKGKNESGQPAESAVEGPYGPG